MHVPTKNTTHVYCNYHSHIVITIPIRNHTTIDQQPLASCTKQYPK